jgi:hypothetical protein
MEYSIKREFATKAGAIGRVHLKAEISWLKIATDENETFIEIPADSIEYLINFGLQFLQDAYAGKPDLTYAIAAHRQRRDRFISGNMRSRAVAPKVSSWQAEARRFMLNFIRNNDAAKVKYAALPDAKARTAYLDERIVANIDTIKPKIDKIIAYNVAPFDMSLDL